MEVSSLIKVLKRKWWIIALITIICAATAFGFRLMGAKEYKSFAELSTGITVNDDLNAVNKYFNPYEISVTFNNLIQSMTARKVVNLVSYELLKHDLKNDVPFTTIKDEEKLIKLDGYLSSLDVFNFLEQKMLAKEPLDPTSQDDRIVQNILEVYGYDFKTLSENLSIKRIDRSDFIRVEYTSNNPSLSAFVVNSISQNYIDFDTDKRKSQSDMSLESLSKLVVNKREELQLKMEQLKNYKSSNSLLDSDIESESKIRQIQDYENQIAAQDQELKASKLSLAKVNEQLNEELTNEKENQDLVELRTLVNRLNERYIMGGSSNSKLYDSIQSVRDIIQIKMSKVRNSARNPLDKNDLLKEKTRLEVDIQIKDSNIEVLKSKLNSLRYSISDFANKEANITTLENEVQIAKDDYTSIQEKYNQAQDKVAISSFNLKQILKGEASDKAESSKKMIFTVFGGALGFFISLFSIVMLEYLDLRIKTPTKFKKDVKLQLAGAVIQMNSDFNIQEYIATSGSKYVDEEHLNHATRKIRYEIENLNGKVILFTSTEEKVGKSFIVMAVSQSLSMMKKRVLIIDTNLRHNTLTQMLIAGEGLKLLVNKFKSKVKLLETKEGGEEAYYANNIVKRTYNQYIDIIGSKASQMTPGEVLSDVDFNSIVEWLKQNYDYIFLEGACLNNYSDSKELTKYVDHVIPVFSAKEEMKAADKESVKYLRSLGPKLAPAILNQVELDHLVA